MHRLGLHEKSERDRAFQRAREAFETGMAMREDEVLMAHAVGYLEGIRDLAIDHEASDLAEVVQNMLTALLGTPGDQETLQAIENWDIAQSLIRERGLRKRIVP